MDTTTFEVRFEVNEIVRDLFQMCRLDSGEAPELIGELKKLKAMSEAMLSTSLASEPHVRGEFIACTNRCHTLACLADYNVVAPYLSQVAKKIEGLYPAKSNRFLEPPFN